MNVVIREYNGAMVVELKAESVADAASLVRLGVNTTQKISVYAFANSSGEVTANVHFHKNRHATSQLPKRGAR